MSFVSLEKIYKHFCIAIKLSKLVTETEVVVITELIHFDTTKFVVLLIKLMLWDKIDKSN